MNRKIKNATPYEYNGIHFRSKLEVGTYKHLVEAGYKPEYEPDVITLLPAFRPSSPWFLDGEPQVTKKGEVNIVRKKTYTPDFKLVVGEHTFYIESKGFANDRFGVERKMFLDWIEKQEDKNIHFAEIHTMRGLHKLIEKLRQLG